jgi:2-polyprenyl-3-methyl-5-hydroxy-6-metoxy-1,4-benzoquinol methylase
MKENIYGHTKRLNWIISHLNKGDTIVELGCGTGVMITLPLAKMGFSLFGVDLDDESIAVGQKIFGHEGLNPKTLKAMDISVLDVVPNVIIASEVLEHIPDGDISNVIRIVRHKLKPGGQFLVTVPNGYGWFELESFLWFKIGLGRLMERLHIVRVVNALKFLLLGCDIEPSYPSTLSSSSHVQRFTHSSIQTLLADEGFKVINITGAVLFAGPISNMFFTGIKPIMRLNCALGRWFPKIASGFYIACRLPAKM